MARKLKVDTPFLVGVIILIIGGFFIFSSASLGLLVHGDVKYSNVTFNQTVFGLLFGTVAFIITSKINYKFWRRHAFYIFIISIVLCLLVFVPKIGFEHGGAKRWLLLGPVSFQPSEILKIAFIIYLSAWISGIGERVKTLKFGLMPLSVLYVICATLLLLQPDTDTFVILFLSGIAIFLVGGGKLKHIGILLLVCIIGIVLVAIFRPYVRSRIQTFIDPSHDPQGSSYQIQQSLIAIGSGKITGRGFGQSIQKFSFLPEPIGDSVFAVAAEEFGFIGSTALIILFVFFAFRGLRIATRAPDTFSGLVVVGIVILIVSQSFVNIGAMLGVFPLTGIPLLFVSQGGTALAITLAEAGIILNISKYQRSSN
ncbi:putative lipid II flippase FtsW [Candidatus Parcubacteria bacterium]|nr:putative lipid II flippase FtsW [Candidatus Parcubacteria bacterium]